MAKKRAAIVGAARAAFLQDGYAEASVNRIAAAAEVSIKTLYRHFENKDDLFSAVMQAVCAENGAGDEEPGWYAEPPDLAFVTAGVEYLRHALSAEQLALYRVVTREADRFPELGRRYHVETAGRRVALFEGFLARWAAQAGWRISAPQEVARIFEALLRAGLFEEVLHGLRRADELDYIDQAIKAASRLKTLLQAGGL